MCQNKDSLIAQKKAVFKEADGFMGNMPTVQNKAVNKQDDNSDYK